MTLRAAFLAPLAVAAALVPPAATAQFAVWSRIGSEDRFAAIFVGRELVTEDGRERLRASADGGLEAEIGGRRMAGVWGWYEDRMCRVLSRGGLAEAGCARAAVARGRLRLYWNAGGATEYLLQ